jgi:hypothetical protein
VLLCLNTKQRFPKTILGIPKMNLGIPKTILGIPKMNLGIPKMVLGNSENVFCFSFSFSLVGSGSRFGGIHQNAFDVSLSYFSCFFSRAFFILTSYVGATMSSGL